jgi:DNA-directed RNA polymerase subunit RPC12/RpoP
MSKVGCLVYPEVYASGQCHNCPLYLDCVRRNRPRYIALNCSTCGNTVELLADWAVHHRVECPYCHGEMK